MNCACPSCHQRFSYSHKPIAMYETCKHLVHETNSCFAQRCPICQIECSTIPTTCLTERHSRYYDVLSITRKPAPRSWRDWFRGVGRLFRIGGIVVSTLLCHRWSMELILVLMRRIRTCLNITVSLKHVERYKNDVTKRVLVVNHTSYLDVFALCALAERDKHHFGCVVNETVETMGWPRWFLPYIPHVIVRQGVENNFEHVKAFFETCDRLCIFPEGMLTHAKTLTEFRSTAFRLGVPVQPILIRYKAHENEVFNWVGWDLLCQPRVAIQLEVLPIMEADKEVVRNTMATEGPFALSSVVNRVC